MKIYFVTTSPYKVRELKRHVEDFNRTAEDKLHVYHFNEAVQEIMDLNIKKVVKAKALDAYRKVGLPCLIEHSGLFMEALPELPGVLGRMIWEAMGDRMCAFLGREDSRVATARSVIGYCDGRRISLFMGEAMGKIVENSRGTNQFNWDPIFIPDGSSKTYAEMTPEEKSETCPFARACEEFLRKEFGGKRLSR